MPYASIAAAVAAAASRERNAWRSRSHTASGTLAGSGTLMRRRYWAWNRSVPPRILTQYASMNSCATRESSRPPSTSRSHAWEVR